MEALLYNITRLGTLEVKQLVPCLAGWAIGLNGHSINLAVA